MDFNSTRELLKNYNFLAELAKTTNQINGTAASSATQNKTNNNNTQSTSATENSQAKRSKLNHDNQPGPSTQTTTNTITTLDIPQTTSHFDLTKIDHASNVFLAAANAELSELGKILQNKQKVNFTKPNETLNISMNFLKIQITALEPTVINNSCEITSYVPNSNSNSQTNAGNLASNSTNNQSLVVSHSQNLVNTNSKNSSNTNTNQNTTPNQISSGFDSPAFSNDLLESNLAKLQPLQPLNNDKSFSDDLPTFIPKSLLQNTDVENLQQKIVQNLQNSVNSMMANNSNNNNFTNGMSRSTRNNPQIALHQNSGNQIMHQISTKNPGSHPCGTCRTCKEENIICDVTSITSHATKETFNIEHDLTCSDVGIYACVCMTCHKQTVQYTNTPFKLTLAATRYNFHKIKDTTIELKDFTQYLVTHYYHDHPEVLGTRPDFKDCYKIVLLEGLSNIGGKTEWRSVYDKWMYRIRPEICALKGRKRDYSARNRNSL